MRAVPSLATVLAPLAMLLGCASSPEAREEAHAPAAHHAAPAHASPEGAVMPEFEGPAARVVIPAAPDASDRPLEVAMIVNEPALKIMTISLRAGTPLPVHQTPYPVTIQAVSGSGTVIAGDERLALPQGGVVVLATGVPHSVEPEGTQTLMLLVHHLRHGAPQPSTHAH